MAKGQMKDRILVFWRDDYGFIEDLGKYTMTADKAQVYKNSMEVRRAMKAFEALKVTGLRVVEFPEIKDHKRKDKKDA